MNQETAAGALIFRRETTGILFLLVYSRRNRLWGFPKGHLEAGESETAAALREIREETGMEELCFIDGFRQEDVYCISGRQGHPVEKHSIYFLAETRVSRVTVDGTEISDFRWVSCEDALAMLSFGGSKQILLNAQAFLNARH